MLPRHQQCSSNGSNLPTACLPREGWTRQNIAANLHRWWYHVQSMKRHHQKKTPHWVLAIFLRNKSQLFLFEILCSLEILPRKVMELEGSIGIGCQPFNYTGSLLRITWGFPNVWRQSLIHQFKKKPLHTREIPKLAALITRWKPRTVKDSTALPKNSALTAAGRIN